MEKITSVSELQNAIAELDRKKKMIHYQLEVELKELDESLSVSNILKGALNKFGGIEVLKTKAASSAIGVGTGWLVQKLVSANSKSILRNITGKVLQFAVTYLVTKSSRGVVEKTIGIMEKNQIDKHRI